MRIEILNVGFSLGFLLISLTKTYEKYREMLTEKREQVILCLSTLRGQDSMEPAIDIFRTDEAGSTAVAVNSERP